LKAEHAVTISTSPFTGHQQVLKYPKETWSASIRIPPTMKDLAEPWVAFLLSLRGKYGTFYLNDPLRITPQGSARNSHTITVNGAVSSGSTINLTSNQVNQTAYLKAGDYISTGASTSKQLFKVLQDVNTDGSGNATLDVWPNVRTSVISGSTIDVQSCQGVFRLLDNTQEWQINSNNAYSISFEAQEAFV